MRLFGKCPGCEKPITHFNVLKVEAFETLQEKHLAIAYLCPTCDTILGAVTHPDNLAAQVSRRL